MNLMNWVLIFYLRVEAELSFGTSGGFNCRRMGTSSSIHEIHCRVHQSLTLVPILGQMNPARTFKSCFIKIHFRIIALPVISSQMIFNFKICDYNFMCIFISSVSAPGPAHFVLLDMIVEELKLWRSLLWNILHSLFVPTPGSKYSLQRPFLTYYVNSFLGPRLHDAMWFARIKSRGIARRRFVQVMECSRLNTEARLDFHYSTFMKSLRPHPRLLTRASQLTSCRPRRGF
jgi:hypothetical protein